MDRVGCEKVSQSPLTFESIFSISASALSAIDQMPIKSERSGFGWTFRIAHASPPAAATGQPISRRSKDIRGQVADTAVANAAPASTPTVSISNAILHLELEPTTLALSGQLMFDRVVCQFNSTSLGERCFDKTNFVFSSNTILGTLVYAAGDAMTITISIEIGHRADAISKSIDGRVAAALEDSLDSGDILDAKVYTYSKRCGYRKASHPRATFINSSILAKIGCEDLDAYFTTKGFGESKPTVLDLHHISSEDSVTDAYDYDSDSDLEEEDDETLPDVKLETAERMNELADDLMLTQGETNKRFLRTGRVVFFHATAYRTWATFMRFVYFDKIAYAKLKSTYIDEEAAVARFSDKTCSPKSMYRFADYFGIENIQNSALGSIKQQLTVDNIVKELFSEFSSHHPKVIEVEVAFLKKNFSHQKVRDGLQDIALRACDGERYMAPALKRVFAEITVTPPEVCLWPEKCIYNQRCGECGSYHVYHHD